MGYFYVPFHFLPPPPPARYTEELTIISSAFLSSSRLSDNDTGVGRLLGASERLFRSGDDSSADESSPSPNLYLNVNSIEKKREEGWMEKMRIYLTMGKKQKNHSENRSPSPSSVAYIYNNKIINILSHRRK